MTLSVVLVPFRKESATVSVSLWILTTSSYLWEDYKCSRHYGEDNIDSKQPSQEDEVRGNSRPKMTLNHKKNQLPDLHSV